MRFLLINQFFAPDPAPTGRLLAHVADALAGQGHRVTVVCGETPYARATSAHCDHAGITVHRLRCASFGRCHAARLSCYASFYVLALRHALAGPRPDVVLTLTTPPLLSLAGTLAAYVRGIRHIHWEMDVYPDLAVALGLLAESSLLERAIGAVADCSRRHADANIVLGPCMRDRLVARGISRANIVVAENWVDGALVSPRPFPDAARLEVLYSGNLGLPHDVDTVAEAMARLPDPSRFHFVFAGGGSRRGPLEARCRATGIQSASFLPYQADDRMADHLGRCHVGLVTQQAGTCGAVVPSKTYAFMAAGRPFIFVGPPQATPAQIADRHRCGWHVSPGDVSSLTTLLELLAASPEMVHLAGARARDAFLNFYERQAGVSRIVAVLTGRPPFSTEPVAQNQQALVV